MQRDFQVNALRTKTKYKLTALRVGMREHILNSLTSLFDNTTLSLPMLAILEALEDKNSRVEDKAEDGVAVSKRSQRNRIMHVNTLKAAEKDDENNDASLVLPTHLTEDKPNDEGAEDHPPTTYKLPGLRKYNKGMGSSILDDSAIGRSKRGSRTKIADNNKLPKSNEHNKDNTRVLRRNSALKSSGDSKPKVKIPPSTKPKGKSQSSKE
ncbi:uncharacterized protein VICG_01836 [Vittaforma corneae ATCC 50505]|uniref:Uncharacterized protein n=1 Tax=Vittaforma corneae (strain ATCC 50505) TaxID=993615 RepID=L2GLI7_VITCO|nr:uncharacterized protein VICG_01836 [Vittaforma corneae ATCC 50505]ELA41137.1 hypothetical protein VICG_01836 [Vittaforma corneae ATCC 50505]